MPDRINNRSVKILIAEDNVACAKRLAFFLQEIKNCEVVGVGRDGKEIILLAKMKKPDIIFMDVNLPIQDGIAAMIEIKKGNPDIKFIMISAYNDENVIQESILNGAKGFLIKSLRYDTIVDAMYTVLSGGTYLDDMSFGFINNRLSNKKSVLTQDPSRVVGG